MTLEIEVQSPGRTITITVSPDEAAKVVEWMEKNLRPPITGYTPHLLYKLYGGLCAIRDGRGYGGH